METAAATTKPKLYDRGQPGMPQRPDRAEQERAQRMYPVARVYEPYAGIDALDDDAMAAFERDGFIAVAGVLDADEVEAYKHAITDAIAQDDGSESWASVVNYEPSISADELAAMTVPQRELAVRKLFGFSKRLPKLGAAGTHPGVLAICERLLGEKVRMMQDMALLKPPGGGVEKPWHQDTAYFRLSTPTKVIGTWAALDRATIENGCMHVIPGSHLAGPTPHYHDRDCQIPDDRIDRANVVAVELEPGDVMFFSGLVYHGTPPNLSTQRRRAMQFHYLAESGVHTEDPEILASLFGDRTGFAGCQGWALGIQTRPLHLRADF